MATLNQEQQQLLEFKSGMSRYGFPIMIALVLGLLGYLGWQWWQHQQQTKAANLSMRYYNVAKQAESNQAQAVAKGQQIIADAPDSVQALQSQLLLAKLAFDQQDYPKANQLLTKASQSKVADEGLIAIAKLHLAYTQVAQNQLDAALKTLDTIAVASFVPTVAETKGDIYMLQNKPEAAKTSYKQAWDVLVKRQQARELLQLKLADLGVEVTMPTPESPINLPTSDVAAARQTATGESAQ